jgi:hypothetical protein
MTRLDADLAAGRLTGPKDLHDRVMEAISDNLTLSLARHPYHLARLVRTVVARTLGPSVRFLADGVAHDADQRLTDERREREGFEERLRGRWRPAIDMLALFRLWCLDAGVTVHERRRPAQGDWVYGALVRLHARACLVTAEVLALLRAGFASGAHARWRSAHEIAVMGFFISQHGQETAERYILHEAIESDRAAVDYQRYATRLGYERLPPEELESLANTREALIARFGSAYATPYGWASKALADPNPKFRDVEAAVSLDHLRPYYRMASYPTHAGPKGIVFDLGLLGDEIMLAGPSNVGLADPGQSVAISLLQITVTLLSLEPDMGDLATMMFLNGACDAAARAFIRVDEGAHDDDADAA